MRIQTRGASWISSVLVLFLSGGHTAAQNRDPYIETFDNGPGGWVANRRDPLPVWDGVAYCFGPWFVDPNHAPPGAGYLHMLMFITTTPKWVARKEYPSNGFVDGKKSTNLAPKTPSDTMGLIGLLLHLVALPRNRTLAAYYSCSTKGKRDTEITLGI